jgi:hypothetical protein
MKNFKNLIIWNNGMKITKSTYKLCNQLPDMV